MTREQYMNELAAAISHCPQSQQDEILADFNEHFDIALSKGHSEEEIIESLGDIQEFIKDLKVEEEHQLKPVTELQNVCEVEIISDDCDVVVIPSEEISMNLKGWRSSMNTAYDIIETQENGKYQFQVLRKNKWPSFFGSSHNLTIEVGVHAAVHKLHVENNLGDIELKLQKLQLREAELDTKNGDISVYGTIGNLSAECRLGDIEVCGNVFSSDLNTANGDIEFHIENGKELKAQSSLGDIEGSAHVETLICHSDKGDVECEAIEAKDVRLSSQYGDIEAKGKAEQYTCQTSKGNVSFQVEAISFSAHSQLGDVEGSAAADNIKCSTAMGDAECKILAVQSAEISSNMGDVKVRVGKLDNYVIETHSSFGDVDLDAKGLSVNKGKYTKGNPSAVIQLHTNMGDIEICD